MYRREYEPLLIPFAPSSLGAAKKRNARQIRGHNIHWGSCDKHHEAPAGLLQGGGAYAQLRAHAVGGTEEQERQTAVDQGENTAAGGEKILGAGQGEPQGSNVAETVRERLALVPETGPGEHDERVDQKAAELRELAGETEENIEPLYLLAIYGKLYWLY